MKTQKFFQPILIIVACLGNLNSFAQNANEEAIKKVIIDEFEAYINQDFQAWISHYVDSPQNAYIITPGRSAGQLVYRTGFEKMKAASEMMFKVPIKGQFDIINRGEWNFRILGNVAWVSYRSTFKMGQDLIPAAELKVFEKLMDNGKSQQRLPLAIIKMLRHPLSRAINL